jgi:metal-responsive CopG/Arc/MetJ family transcriptional regulator
MMQPYPYAEKLSVTIPPKLFDRVELARSRLRISRSRLVKSALEAYLNALDRAEKMIDEQEEALVA